MQAEVTDYMQRPGYKDLVRVTVTVESESQRGILIGKDGSALKKLSTASRENIEGFLGEEHLQAGMQYNCLLYHIHTIMIACVYGVS